MKSINFLTSVQNYFVAKNCSPEKLTLQTFTLSKKALGAGIIVVALRYVNKKLKTSRTRFGTPACLCNTCGHQTCQLKKKKLSKCYKQKLKGSAVVYTQFGLVTKNFKTQLVIPGITYHVQHCPRIFHKVIKHCVSL